MQNDVNNNQCTDSLSTDFSSSISVFTDTSKSIIALFDTNVVYGLTCLVVYVDSNTFKMHPRKCIIGKAESHTKVLSHNQVSSICLNTCQFYIYGTWSKVTDQLIIGSKI